MSNTNVPKNMFVIWIGPKEPPMHFINTYKDLHPDWKFRIVDNDEFYGRKWHNQSLIDVYLSEGRYPGVADCIRYQLLYEEGGFSPAADSVCLEPIDELFTDRRYDAYGVYENETVRPGLISPLYAASKGNPFAKALMMNLPKTPPKGVSGKSKAPWQCTGNLYMKKMRQRLNYPKLKIWPSHYFTPIHHSGHTYKGNDKVYAVQQWGSTTDAGFGAGKYTWPPKD